MATAQCPTPPGLPPQGFRSGEIRIDPQGAGKASISADNEDLPAADLVEPRRRSWQAALDALRLYLADR